MIQCYFIMPMPVDEKGRGPELDPSKVSHTLFQVWDIENTTVFESVDEKAAREHCNKLNAINKGPSMNKWKRIADIASTFVLEDESGEKMIELLVSKGWDRLDAMIMVEARHAGMDIFYAINREVGVNATIDGLSYTLETESGEINTYNLLDPMEENSSQIFAQFWHDWVELVTEKCRKRMEGIPRICTHPEWGTTAAEIRRLAGMNINEVRAEMRQRGIEPDIEEPKNSLIIYLLEAGVEL